MLCTADIERPSWKVLGLIRWRDFRLRGLVSRPPVLLGVATSAFRARRHNIIVPSNTRALEAGFLSVLRAHSASSNRRRCSRSRGANIARTALSTPISVKRLSRHVCARDGAPRIGFTWSARGSTSGTGSNSLALEVLRPRRRRQRLVLSPLDLIVLITRVLFSVLLSLPITSPLPALPSADDLAVGFFTHRQYLNVLTAKFRFVIHRRPTLFGIASFSSAAMATTSPGTWFWLRTVDTVLF